MPALLMMITDAGLDALVDAENAVTGPIEIVSVGLTDTPFVMAPTLTALPGEHKVIDTISGQAAADNIIHVTAYDTSAETYDVTGFGLYLDDGTLFAVYSAAALPILTKAQLAFGLFSFDIAFLNNAAANITFGNAIFSYPPATETVKGIARIATQARVDAAADAGDDFETIVTPKTLRVRLAAFFATVADALDAMTAAIGVISGRTITGTGAATGGGDLTANRQINVPIASAANIIAASGASAVGEVLTTREIGLMPRAKGSSGYMVHPGGIYEAWGEINMGAPNSANVTLPFNFPNSVRNVLIAPAFNVDNSDEADELYWPVPGSYSASGFTISSRGDGPSGPVSWRALGD